MNGWKVKLSINKLYALEHKTLKRCKIQLSQREVATAVLKYNTALISRTSFCKY